MRSLLVNTEMGCFEIALEEAARDTCNYFVAAATDRVFDGGSVFRIVSRAQQGNSSHFPIDVVQVGTQRGLQEERQIIRHEHTGISNIPHQKWVVSAARYAPGELYYSFFVCLKDEPELDYGGNRQADGQGFAAFGRIVSGFEVVENIFDRAESSDELCHPIRIIRIEVKLSEGAKTCTELG